MNISSKLLPLVIIVSILSLSVRFSEVVTGISNISSAAHAKTEKKTDKHEEESKEEDNKHNDDIEVVDDKESMTPQWRDANDSDLDVTGVKLDLFKDLSKRREQLDKAEKNIQVREALLKAAEGELTRKYQELTKLRNEIVSLLDKQSEEEDKRIISLVKIYEGMKPKNAARIFDTLDLDVLISVISKMSERKVSPVLAAMNPERVRTVTIMLAEQKKLPTFR